jgi:polysaccharide export outer membrane protein
MEWGRIPLPMATDDPTGKFSVADVNLQEIMLAKNPAQNILIAPEDVISVPRAEMVYVIGQVSKPGGYILGEHESFSVLKALSLAGGFVSLAAPQNARILRPVAGNAKRQEIPVDLRTIMTAKSPDVPMQPEDILFVPLNGPQKAMARAAEAAIQLTTGIILYRR